MSEAASISRLSISEHRFEHRAYLTVSINLLRFIARTGYKHGSEHCYYVTELQLKQW